MKPSVFFLAGLTASLCGVLPTPLYAQTTAMPPMEMAAVALPTVQSQGTRLYSEAEIAQAQAGATAGTIADDKTHLTFAANDVRLVVTTGPDDDMLSYRIAGLRNPTVRVPAGATLRVLFLNTDEDMRHDIHFGTQKPPFPSAPDVSKAPGTATLPPESHDNEGHYSGEEITVKLPQTGAFTYFCSVKGHAKGGMFGTLLVGDAPEPTAPAVPTADHEHSAMGGMAGMDMGKSGDAAMPGMNHDHAALGDTAPLNGSQGQTGDNGAMMMRSSIDLTDTMSRESSGTAWVPDSSPMYARMKMKGKDMFMVHGMAYPRYTHTGGDRDASVAGRGSNSKLDAPNMVMGMYSHPLNSVSQLGVRLMLSLDPLTEQDFGYPLLYQSGESYKGKSLHDRQHPHDLVAELSATYSRRIGAKSSAFLYVGYPGEPALGPPTFMHRLSAMDNPDAPISHHWQDSTHITFGVVTLGYSLGRVKLEGSVFKGEEPNENRLSFDSPRLDSYSTRLSWNPTRDLALQASYGYLKRPEPGEPEVDTRRRITASAIYNRPIGTDSNWANTFVFGRNEDSGINIKTNSYLLESALQMGKNTFYGRFEHVGKAGEELALPTSYNQDDIYGVSSYALGYVRDLRRNKGLDIGLGGQVTFGTNPSGLNSLYGGSSHTGYQVFLRLRPSKLRAEDMGMGNMNGMAGMHGMRDMSHMNMDGAGTMNDMDMGSTPLSTK